VYASLGVAGHSQSAPAEVSPVFERYTEHARRVIFFARYEASVLGSSAIDTEHLLLGWLRETARTSGSLLKRAGLNAAEMRKQIESQVPAGPPMSTAVDIPLSPAAKRALQRAGEEADRGGSPAIDVDHVFLGLLGEPDTAAGRYLRSQGLHVDEVREDVRLALPSCAPAAAPRELPFEKLVHLLRTLDDRRVPHHVAAFRADAIRVEVARPEERWAVTFFADGHVGVDVFGLTAERHDESTLAALLHKLGEEPDDAGRPR
jgi:hypothetical protein